MTDRYVSRRSFLVATAAGGALVLGFSLTARRGHEGNDFEPNLWVRIDAAGNVHLRIRHPSRS